MNISHCKLLKNQVRLAADVLGIQIYSAALFYRKVRAVITHHLEQEAHEMFEDAVELDESYFRGARKGKRGRGGARARSWYSVF